MRGAAAILVATLLAPLAAAHGSSTEAEARTGGYVVTFYGYDYATKGEELRLGWKVVDNATAERVDMNRTMLAVTDVDASGNAAGSRSLPLTQSTPGFVYADVVTAGRGLLRLHLPLPRGNVTFDQQVCDIDDQGQLVCGLATAATPGPDVLSLLAVLGLGATAAVAYRRR